MKSREEVTELSSAHGREAYLKLREEVTELSSVHGRKVYMELREEVTELSSAHGREDFIYSIMDIWAKQPTKHGEIHS